MKKFFNWQVVLGLSLISLSALIYFIHYLIFRDSHHIFIYMLGEIAFVPIEVLLVTLIIHRLLSMREKRSLLKKMNMVIGAFFSEVGISLLKSFSSFDSQSEKTRNKLIVDNNWTNKEFISRHAYFEKYDCKIECTYNDIKNLRNFLENKRGFLLGLLQNPNLLEHESFTDILWAVFHLTEELTNRNDVSNLTHADHEHLLIDIKRVYIRLIVGWISYMMHLKADYPYLFSMAIRMNPFDKNALVEIKG
ncbi:MAG: hypothetical protein LLF28_02475 [Nitrospiraceae bacterium]|nr:hypothetical protein [Nitrospiraceae bacterium]